LAFGVGDWELAIARNWWDNQAMKNYDANWHPGPWRVMPVNSEFAGLLVAVGFLVMGFVRMPVAAWLVSGALGFGGAIVLLLHFLRKSR
jgi:hypothetical protein